MGLRPYCGAHVKTTFGCQFVKGLFVCENERNVKMRLSFEGSTEFVQSCSVWDPHNKRDINQIEAVQRRVARYVKNRYHNTSSPSEMLKELQWESLEQRRAKLRLINMFKITQGLLLVTSPYLVRSSFVSFT